MAVSPTPQDQTTLESNVPQAMHGMTLRDYLTRRFPYESRDSWSRLINTGKLLVNGQPARSHLRLRKGDRVSYVTILAEPEVPTTIPILYETDDFLVVDKPALLPCHADGNFIRNTLIWLLQERLRQSGFQGKLHLMHRLDREASGVMLVCKDSRAIPAFARQFEQGEVRKEYLALVRGRIEQDRFAVTKAIGRDTQSAITIKRAAFPSSTPATQEAHTEFQVVDRANDVTLVQAMPHTGRTHQIRVHLASQGYPLLGDHLYGTSDAEYLAWLKLIKQDRQAASRVTLAEPRLMLHACRLSLRHHLTGAMIEFQAALPGDMAAVWARHGGIHKDNTTAIEAKHAAAPNASNPRPSQSNNTPV